MIGFGTGVRRSFATALCLGLALAASGGARPYFVEKAVKVAVVSADRDDEKVPVIVEGWNGVQEIRDLLGAHAGLDLGLIGAVSGSVPVARLRELLEDGRIKAIYKDEPVELVAPVGSTTDPASGAIQVPREGEMLEVEESSAGITYGLRLIRAPEAIEFVTKFRKMVAAKLGRELPKVRVGVLDTGVDGHHKSLEGVIARFGDMSYDFSPEARDDHGHGTHVAGTIAGGTSPEGIRFGVAPPELVELAVARGLNPHGMDSWLISGLAWMVDPDGNPATPDGVQVVNNSWGSSSRKPVYDRLVKALTSMGVTLVFACGNSGPEAGTIGSPAHLPEVISVGAVDHRGRIAPFSSRGDQIVNKAEIPVKPDVSAPGVAIYSIAPRNQFERWNGTSMAAPHVTGVVALMKAVNPGMRPRDVKLVLEATARDLGPPGKDEEFGTGLVDALAAVQKAASMLGATLEPDDPQALIDQAKEFMRTRQTQYAVENLMKVINAYPNLDLARKIEAGYLMGEGFRELGNLKGALEAYKGVVMFDAAGPLAAKAEYWMAWCWLNTRGGNLVAHQKHGAAQFEAWLAKYPEHEWFDLASLELARSYLKLEEREAALAALKRLMEARPHTAHRLTVMQMLESLQEGAGAPPEL